MTRSQIAAPVVLAALLFPPGPAPAQEIAPMETSPAGHPAVRRALEHVAETEERTISEQIAICEIPAPPFGEAERAAAYRDHLAALGLERVRIDAEGNVIGERPGAGEGPTVVLSAHLDTVFPEGTDVTVEREGPVLKGPGIGDDCRGLAVLLAIVRALDFAGIETRGDLLFLGTVGEEGRGDLRGVRHLFTSEIGDRIDAFVSVDGGGLDLVKDAVGSHRYRVVYSGPGGHSYGDFGMPSPIHALGRAIARIAELEVPEHPKTTFNVGVIEGGTSINSVAYEGSMLVDLRSLDPAELADLDARFREAVEAGRAAESARDPDTPLAVEVENVGIRPAGTQPHDAPIVRAAVDAAEPLGFEPALKAASTDANIPISLGVPAITIDGGGESEGAHSLEETFDTTDSHLGSQWALLTAIHLAGLR
ncbi:MAG: M20/M25/M40 family metallo-hydrolase [Gemmatimonadota bacterium]|nr:M20/M25/M40 family metallo-hydrolase [Gemmatimonadota bacterium]